MDFIKILKEIVKNQVGQALVKSINDKLTELSFCGSKRYPLNVIKITEPTEISTMNFAPAFDDTPPTIKFTELSVFLTVIDVQNKTCLRTQLKETEPDIILFHEMLHWAHFLLDANRMMGDACRTMQERAGSTFFSNDIFDDFPVATSFLGDSTKIIQLTAHCNQWLYQGKFAPTNRIEKIKDLQLIFNTAQYANGKLFPVVKVEEFRTIIGSGNSSPHPLDQISENAYRLAKFKDLSEEWLRYGHGLTPCDLSEAVIEWIVSRAAVGCTAACNFLRGPKP